MVCRVPSPGSSSGERNAGVALGSSVRVAVGADDAAGRSALERTSDAGECDRGRGGLHCGEGVVPTVVNDGRLSAVVPAGPVGVGVATAGGTDDGPSYTCVASPGI
jgi:hypothetical protein